MRTLIFDRIDNLQYRVDWLYHTTVRYLNTGIIDARIVRCLRKAIENFCTDRDQLFNVSNRPSSVALEKSPEYGKKVLKLVLGFYKKCLKFSNSARKLLAVTFFLIIS